MALLNGGIAKALGYDLSNTASPTAGTGNLFSMSIPAKTLNATGDSLRFLIAGTFGSSTLAVNRKIQITFGGTLVFDTGNVSTATAGKWQIEGAVFRKSDGSQITSASFVSSLSGAVGSVDIEPSNATLANANAFIVTGTGTNAGDVTGTLLQIFKLA